MGFSSWPAFWRLMITTFLVILILNFVSSSVNYYLSFIGLFFAIPHVSWLIARLIKRRLLPQATFVSPSRRSVLVTGCDSGFGNLVARRLDAYGFTVFAGCLFPDGDGAKKLAQETSKTFRIVKLDVTSKEDVERTVREIEATGLDLWAVVNNAGVAQYLPAEWGSDVEEYERMFNVNVYGLVRVTKAFLPLLRRSKGRVVNLSSMAGKFFDSFYVPTDFRGVINTSSSNSMKCSNLFISRSFIFQVELHSVDSHSTACPKQR